MDDDIDSMVIVRNRMIGLQGMLDGINIPVYEDKEMIENSKSIVVYKNPDTYITDKIENIWNHEL